MIPEAWRKSGIKLGLEEGRETEDGWMKRQWNVRKKKDADSNEVVEAMEGSEETGKGVVQKRV